MPVPVEKKDPGPGRCYPTSGTGRSAAGATMLVGALGCRVCVVGRVAPGRPTPVRYARHCPPE